MNVPRPHASIKYSGQCLRIASPIVSGFDTLSLSTPSRFDIFGRLRQPTIMRANIIILMQQRKPNIPLFVMPGLDPRLSGTVFASQGELELGQRRQGEISLPPLDSADKGWYLDAMKEGVSDRCEEVRRGFLRFGSIVQQLEQQIGNDGGSNLKPDGVGRAAMKVADFQVLFDPAEKQFDLPAGLVEIGNGLCLSRSLVNSLSV